MTERQERRTPGVNRVAVARLVDICGRDQSVPAFEAQSVELSGRGMHVRTPFLPPLGAPLVCRLEDDGREIVVEGVVAWQANHEGGGEFGIQFTALDSGSVEALRALCGLPGSGPSVSPKETKRSVPETKDQSAPPGLPVKLHIEGLGAPMKARVKTGSTRKLQVGSNLEFLKVGRGLEVEDVEHGDRRGAKIDSVSIAIDPETQVPQLVVMLRYQGEDTTPEPSVVDDESEPVLAVGVSSHEARPASEASPPASADEDAEDELLAQEEEDDEERVAAAEEADAMRGKVDQMAARVGKAAQRASDRLGEAGTFAAENVGKWMKVGTAKLVQMAKQRGQAKRRSTAPAPSAPSTEHRRLRPQNGPSPEATAEVESASKKKKVVLAAAAGAVVSVSALAFALAGHGSKKDAAAAAPADAVAVAPAGLPPLGAAPAAAAAPAMAVAPAPAAPLPGVQGQMPMAGALGQMPGAAQPMAAQVPGGPRSGVVANVPLFGPTPMATLEPAPLGPAPDQITAFAASGVKPAAEEERMDEGDDKAEAADESFGSSRKDSADKDKSDDKKSADAVAESVKPFLNGKMHLPVVYKLPLDKPGAALEGKKEAAGFSVTIPGRKIEGSGTTITKRDDRIADVRVKNGSGGARVTFVFRSKVPSYKVRLKKSSVEFFISSPDSAK
ncbi:MAG TPA: PilZ domain-containing protein [Polyangiaceae bacterium]|nr:PilZ domain-containing protein [Polyangiaceae bacterium]